MTTSRCRLPLPCRSLARLPPPYAPGRGRLGPRLGRALPGGLPGLPLRVLPALPPPPRAPGAHGGVLPGGAAAGGCRDGCARGASAAVERRGRGLVVLSLFDGTG
eukprot:12701710-Alexandrium_andersonii.AAC.1